MIASAITTRASAPPGTPSSRAVSSATSRPPRAATPRRLQQLSRGAHDPASTCRDRGSAGVVPAPEVLRAGIGLHVRRPSGRARRGHLPAVARLPEVVLRSPQHGLRHGRRGGPISEAPRPIGCLRGSGRRGGARPRDLGAPDRRHELHAEPAAAPAADAARPLHRFERCRCGAQEEGRTFASCPSCRTTGSSTTIDTSSTGGRGARVTRTRAARRWRPNGERDRTTPNDTSRHGLPRLRCARG